MSKASDTEAEKLKTEEFVQQSTLAAQKAAEREKKAEPDKPKPEAKKEKLDLSGVNQWGESFTKGEPMPAAKKEGEEKAKEEKPKEEKAKTEPVKKPVRKPAPRPESTPESIAAAAAEAVAKVMVEQKTEPEKKEVEAESRIKSLSDANQRRHAIIQNMAKLFPDKYKGLPEQFVDNSLALQEYAAEWEKNNPGKTFDEEDDEHQEFYASHQVDWEDDDYVESVADIRAQKLVQAEREKSGAELAELKTKEKIREQQPKIIGLQLDSARKFWEALGDGLGDVIKTDGTVNAEKLAELEKNDPVVASIQIGNANRLAAETATLYRIMNSLERFDDKNPMHQYLSEFGEEQERRMMKQPAEDRLDSEGRPFMPATKYFKLPAAERKKHWTYSEADYAVLLANETAKRTAQEIKFEDDKFAKRAAARGISLEAKRQEQREVRREPEEEENEERGAKPVSPSATGASKLAASREGKKGGEPNSLNAWARGFVGPG